MKFEALTGFLYVQVYWILLPVDTGTNGEIKMVLKLNKAGLSQ